MTKLSSFAVFALLALIGQAYAQDDDHLGATWTAKQSQYADFEANFTAIMDAMTPEMARFKQTASPADAYHLCVHARQFRDILNHNIQHSAAFNQRHSPPSYQDLQHYWRSAVDSSRNNCAAAAQAVSAPWP
ncbi:hypothetical protein LVJ82_05450 [Vitreoscilla massiliensis]|uniref:Uncharacterized protein n=1 Tax=Vitreoscilla massiliensis TaxID=1689272 RepID=A0ABY4E539_9NEIS|nr:hypothetical protein [Vitreoscilla massiliensis]UOO90424.1 hypothetical protein LVJ82_05450 [Vitreoscilla massiliensis]